MKKSYKAICKIINSENKEAEYTVYIKDAKDEDDAESKAKYFMILERPEINFIRVEKVTAI